MIVALCAIVLSAYQMIENRRFERLRFEPIIDFDMGKNFDDGFYITIQNRGLGIADIEYFLVFYDEKIVPHWGDLFVKVQENAKIDLPTTNFDQFSVPDGSITPSEGKRFLFRESDALWINEFWNQRRRVSLVACACSQLGDCSLSTHGGAERTVMVPECKVQSDGGDLFVVPPNF